MIGTISTILQLLKLPDGTIKVLVEGVDRARVIQYLEEEDFLKAQCPTISLEPYPAWFDRIVAASDTDVPPASEDPNDWWDDEDWELCETGLCAEDDLPCPCTTVPRNPEEP